MDRFLKHFWGILVLVAFGTYLMLGPVGSVLSVGAAFWWRARLRAQGYDPRYGRDENERFAAFVARAEQDELSRRLTEGDGSTHSESADPPAPVAAPRRESVDAMHARIATLDSHGLFEALAAARLASTTNPRDCHAAVEAALIAKRIAADAAHTNLRIGLATRALETCLANGHGALAGTVFELYRSERTRIKLAPQQWESLGRVLLSRGAFMQAAWAMHAGAVLAGDPVAAQKRLVETAERARAQGDADSAKRLFKTLLEKYPDSPFADFVRGNLLREHKRAGTD